ncbi:hypothetical protein HMPREF3034_00721 [Prevotella sp. DNF00663]|nr:hypothetical protein HMPREF3034_00721 [Prevotella sp. DNF00663]
MFTYQLQRLGNLAASTMQRRCAGFAVLLLCVCSDLTSTLFLRKEDYIELSSKRDES